MRHTRHKRTSKEKNQRHHTRMRALQRYGQQLTNDDLEKMAEIYRHSPDTWILHKQSCRVIKAIITYKETVYPIIYDKHRHQIVTILSPTYLNNREREIYNKCLNRLKQTTQHTSGLVVLDSLSETSEITSKQEEIVEEIVGEIKEENDYVEFPSKEEQKSLMDKVMSELNF